METLNQYGKLDRLFAIKEDILSGSKFNGAVYGEAKGKMINMHVYIDGKKRYIREVEKLDSELVKTEVLEFLQITKKTANQKAKMTYSDAYEMFGLDFAEEGEY